jgi:hypothetical protein
MRSVSSSGPLAVSEKEKVFVSLDERVGAGAGEVAVVLVEGKKLSWWWCCRRNTTFHIAYIYTAKSPRHTASYLPRFYLNKTTYI